MTLRADKNKLVLKKCVVCGKEFSGNKRARTCGFLCSDSPKMLNTTKRRKFEKFLRSHD